MLKGLLNLISIGGSLSSGNSIGLLLALTYTVSSYSHSLDFSDARNSQYIDLIM